MPITPDQCVNYEINLLMCPCTSDSCTFRGICCECIRASVAAGEKTVCMTDGVKRDPETMSLKDQASSDCVSKALNLQTCACKSDSCDRQGICCNCVRAHFTVDGTGRVACMR